jgi:hypothetical protein
MGPTAKKLGLKGLVQSRDLTVVYVFWAELRPIQPIALLSAVP